MPIVQKQTSTSKSMLLAWMCCSPCAISCGVLTGLVACLTCTKCVEFDTAATIGCYPCYADHPLSKKAAAIAEVAISFIDLDDQISRTLSLLAKLKTEAKETPKDHAREKLEDLAMYDWSPVETFYNRASINSPTVRLLTTTIKNAILPILDNYDLTTTVKSDTLNESDLKFIAKALRTIIFTELLPTKDQLRDAIQQANVNTKDTAALNNVLYGYLLGKLQHPPADFFKNALGVAGEKLEQNRASKALIASQRQTALFGAMAAGAKLAAEAPQEQKMQARV